MASHFSLQLLLPCMEDSSSAYYSFLGAAQKCPPAAWNCFHPPEEGDLRCRNPPSRTTCAPGSTSALEFPNTCANLDAVILMGPFQLGVFCSSMILSWGQEMDYLCWPCASHVLDRQNLAEDKTQQATGRNTTGWESTGLGSSQLLCPDFGYLPNCLRLFPGWWRTQLETRRLWVHSQPSHFLDTWPWSTFLCLSIFPVYEIDVVIHGELWDQGLKRSLRGEWPLLYCTSNCNNRSAELFVHLET